MNYLEKVIVEGFWGSHEIDMSFHKDVNFLIGVNGSGKTTLLNLIASVISGNTLELLSTDFNRIMLIFRAYKGPVKPSIEVVKDEAVTGNFFFVLKHKASSEKIHFDFSYMFDANDRRIRRHSLMRERQLEQSFSLRSELRKIAKISWLTVHRANPSPRADKTYASQVDQKLDEVSTRLIQYFGSLSSETEKKSESFQQDFLLQMLIHRAKSGFSLPEDTDLHSQKNALYDIFDSFNIPRAVFLEKIDNHFNILEKSTKNIREQRAIQDGGMDADDYINVITAQKFNNIIKAWMDIRIEREKIFKPRNLFFEIVNSMMNRKKVYLDEDYNFLFKTDSGKNMDLDKLSSGEKQLFILIAEATLQKSEHYLYFADEPELSLHVKWQNRVVESLVEINPNAQIVFATHSPDIVGKYSSKIHDMEKRII